jgi:hypothetical protein
VPVGWHSLLSSRARIIIASARYRMLWQPLDKAKRTSQNGPHTISHDQEEYLAIQLKSSLHHGTLADRAITPTQTQPIAALSQYTL